jgi:hypothetical protein
MPRPSGKSFSPLLVALLIAASSILTACESERRDGAQALLQAFAGGCQSYGEWSERALGQTQALVGVLESLAGQDRCRGVRGALSSTLSISLEISRLTASPTASALRQSQERVQQLHLALEQLSQATPSDLHLSQANYDAYREALSTELATATIAATTSQADESLRQSQLGTNRAARGITHLNQYLDSLFSPDTHLAACAADNPALAFQLGASGLAIAGTAVNPVAGVVISAVGGLLSGIIQWAREAHMDQAILQVRSPQMAAALACGMESMATTFCEAQDRLSLIQTRAQNYSAAYTPSVFWRGVDLWANRLPSLLTWIRQISSGVEPGDRYNAARQNDASSGVELMIRLERSTEGLIRETINEISNLPPGSSAAASLVRRGLVQLIYLMRYGVINQEDARGLTPIASFYSSNVSLGFQLAQGTPPPAGCTSDNNCSLDQIPLPADFNSIAARVREVFLTVSATLQNRLRLVVNNDPSSILRSGVQSSDPGRPPPVEVMREMIEFLDESEQHFRRLASPEHLYMIPMIRETREIMVLAIQKILPTTAADPEYRGTSSASPVSVGPGGRYYVVQMTPEHEAVQDLYGLFHLNYGLDFIAGRLFQHIRLDLVSRIDHRQGIGMDVDEILRGSSRTAVDDLLTGGERGLDRLVRDLATAQAVSQSNIENFVDLFQVGLQQALVRLNAEAERAREPRNDWVMAPNRTTIARICTLIATGVSAWPRGIDKRLCQGAQLQSIYPNFSERVSVDDLMSSQNNTPLRSRICTYRNFLRRSRLYELQPAVSRALQSSRQIAP